MAALAAGRLTKERQLLEDELEETRFALTDIREFVEHLSELHKGAIESTVEARRDVDAAEKRLAIAKRRLDCAERREEESAARVVVMTGQIDAWFAANEERIRAAGFGHHIQAAAVVESPLTALAKRRQA